MNFKIIIAGGRDFDDYGLLERTCDKLCSNKDPNITIVSGVAKGADNLGEVFAIYNRYKIKRFPADWNNLDVTPCLIRYNRFKKPYNALAGNNRNKQMGIYSDAAIIFDTGGREYRDETIRRLENL